MIASAHQIISALADAAKDLDVDFRDIERQVAQLVPETRWFTHWAKEHRPGTRGSSHPLPCTGSGCTSPKATLTCPEVSGHRS